MRNKRDSYIWRILLAFLLTNVIFSLIFLFSFSISYFNYQGISTNTNLIQKDLTLLEELGDRSSCNNPLFYEASEKLDEVGIRLSLLETRFGKKDSRVLEQKALYTELERKHLEIVRKLDRECEREFTTILFFYSNNKPFNDESEKIGFILSTFKNINPKKIMVYSFDFDQSYWVTDGLKEKYGITSAPIIVVNEKKVFRLKNIDELNEYL